MGVEVKFRLFQSSGASVSQNGAPDNDKYHYFPQLKTDQLPQIFVPISKMKFLDIVTKTVTGAAVLKTVKFTLMYNPFRLLAIKDNHMNKSSAGVRFH
jgi:hypothetical protein